MWSHVRCSWHFPLICLQENEVHMASTQILAGNTHLCWGHFFVVIHIYKGPFIYENDIQNRENMVMICREEHFSAPVMFSSLKRIIKCQKSFLRIYFCALFPIFAILPAFLYNTV